MKTLELIQMLWEKYKLWFKNDKQLIINGAAIFIMFIVIASISLSSVIRNDNNNLYIVEIIIDFIVLVLFNIIDCFFRRKEKQNKKVFVFYNICLVYFLYAFVKNLHWVAFLFLVLFCINLPHYNEKDNKAIKVIKKLVRILFFLLYLLALVINDMNKNDVHDNYKMIVVVIILYYLLIPFITSTCFRWYENFKDAYCEQAIGILFLIFAFYICVFFTNDFTITNLTNTIGWGCTFVGINSLSNTK